MEILAGAVVSFVVELVKRYLGTSTLGSLAAFFVVAGLGSAGYVYLQGTEYLETLLKVGSYASLIYGVLINTWNKSQA